MNLKSTVLIAFVALTAAGTFSEEIVALKSGKQIKILDNRTWIEIDTVRQEKPSKQPFDTAKFLSMIDAKFDKFNGSEVYSPKGIFKTQEEIELYPMVFCIRNSCKINLKMISTSRDGWRFLKFRNLIGLCDGERFEFEEPSHNGTIGRGYVLEQMYVKLPELSLQRLSSCKSLELKLGIHEITIPFKNRESWRLMSNRFE